MKTGSQASSDRLPELPQAMRDRLIKEFGLSPYEANVLTQTREMASYYEALVESSGGLHKLAASWVMGELSAALKRASLEIENSPISSQRLAGLLKRIQDNTISGRTAKDVFDAMWNTNVEADAVISDRGLKTDLRHRRVGEDRRWRSGRESRPGSRVSRRPRESLQLPGRTGHEGLSGEGQSRPDQ